MTDKREQIIERIIQKKIIAIVRGIYGQECLKLAQALYDGGIELLEVTFDQSSPEDMDRTADAVGNVSSAMDGKMLVGAGTVTSIPLLEKAADAGAGFIISPNVDELLITATLSFLLIFINRFPIICPSFNIAFHFGQPSPHIPVSPSV